MKIEHVGLDLSVGIKDLTQRDMEEFYAKLREGGDEEAKTSIPEYSGIVVRIAKDLEWITDPGEVDEMKPAAVLYLQQEITRIIADAMTIPPE